MIKLNLKPGQGYTPIAAASQYDLGRELVFTIYDGMTPASIPSGTIATMVGTKPSGLGFTTLGTVYGNEVTVVTTATMTAEGGHIPAELRLTYNGKNIGTANFVFGVEPSPHPEDVTDGDAETARDLMTRAEDAVTEAESAAQSAAASAARAEEAAAGAGLDATGAGANQVPTADGNGNWSWQNQQGGGGGGSTSDDITNESSVSGETVTAALNSLSGEIANLEGGGAVPVSTVAQMSDTTKIYLYTGSETGYTAGHWYYYDGSAWVDGGEYGAVSSNVFSDYAKELLVTILRSAMYTSDQSDNIDRLEDALARQVIAIGATIDLGGNTIYTDDELDTLRQYLTVTATYDDMTTSPVTGYALSGTLVAGTSTITITYQGNSTTVSVPVSQAVVRYAVTYNLTGVTSSNTDTTIAEGNTYATTLTAETAGYIPTNVVVTLGGTDVTATAYNTSTHAVSIANVNGAISITAVEDEDPNAPVYELTSPLVLGDATDTRINLPDTCQVATGVTIADDETWTLCVDFTSANGVATVNNTNVVINDRNTKLYYYTPNWVIQWHNNSQTVMNDRVSGAWDGKNIVCVLTHEAGATVANLYGTVSGEINNTHTLTNAGQIKLGSVTGAGTINKFAIYKRVLTASEIAEWTGA